MRRVPFAILALAAIAGCAAAPPTAPTVTDVPRPSPSSTEIWRIAAGCGGCREPSVAALPNGALAVVPMHAGMTVIVGNSSANVTRALPAPASGAPGGDALVYTNGDRLWLVRLVGPPGASPTLLQGAGIQVASSADEGRSWDRNVVLSSPAAQPSDRPWLAFWPGDRMALVWTAVGPTAAFVATSPDGGRSWEQPGAIPVTAAGGIVRVGAPEVDPASSALLVPFIDAAARVEVARSTDAGASFTLSTVDATGDAQVGEWPTGLAAAAGRLALAWRTSAGAIELSTSADAGATWSPRAQLASSATRALYPSAVGLADGGVVISWLGGSSAPELDRAVVHGANVTLGDPIQLRGEGGSSDFLWSVKDAQGGIVTALPEGDGVVAVVRYGP